MCGISGILTLQSSRGHRESIEKMVRSLHHRGPDDQGVYSNENGTVHLGHNRLSIIDLGSRSKQPFLSSDAQFVLTFNGEIYNYLELRIECEKLGSKFRTSSDTEVIIESYRHWGIECLRRFKGMWAFVLYDKHSEQALISRDFFGIKPLFFSLTNNTLSFASEVKALRNSEPDNSIVDEVTVRIFEEYGYLDRGAWTFYKHIKRFPHCKYLLVDLKSKNISLDFKGYWTPYDVDYSSSFKNYKDAMDCFSHLHKESIKLHCRSDVQVGSCLSGGLDSTSILSQAVGQTSSFSTFTTQYKEYPEIDESGLASMVSKKFGANQHFITPSIKDFKDHLKTMLISQDEPFGSTSIFSQYMVFREINKNKVKVVLDGQGADELMGGYLYITRFALNEFLSRKKYLLWFRETLAFSRNHGVNYWKTIRNITKNSSDRNDPIDYFRKTVQYKDAETLEERLAFDPSDFKSLQEYTTFLSFEGNLQQLLRYEDRNSMNFSIESRVPFLEPELVSFLLQMPTEYKFRNGFTKSVLRDAYQGIVPDEILWQKNKMGFPAPEKAILKEAYGIDVSGPGTLAWRKFIVNQWRSL